MACASHACGVVTKLRGDVEPMSFTILTDEVGTISDEAIAEKTRALQKWYETNASWGVIAKRIHALMPNKEVTKT